MDLWSFNKNHENKIQGVTSKVIEVINKEEQATNSKSTAKSNETPKRRSLGLTEEEKKSNIYNALFDNSAKAEHSGMQRIENLIEQIQHSEKQVAQLRFQKK